MPTKQIRDDVSPAWRYLLIAGRPVPCRIRGWVEQAQGGMFGEPTADQVWQQHREALLEEAAAHGFEPAMLTGRKPTGEGFERWRKAFLAANTY